MPTIAPAFRRFYLFIYYYYFFFNWLLFYQFRFAWLYYRDAHVKMMFIYNYATLFVSFMNVAKLC